MQPDLEHPGDDELTALALDETVAATIRDHVEGCPACSRFVKEICLARDLIRSLPDLSIPENVRRAIIRRRRVHPAGLHFNVFSDLAQWLRHPLTWGVVLLAGIIALFIFMVFVL